MYLIVAYSKEKNNTTSSHIYPCYFTCYNGNQYGLQSGIYDALKFQFEGRAKEELIIANKKFGDKYEFTVINVNNLMLGKYEYKYVIEERAKTWVCPECGGGLLDCQCF